MDCFKQSDVLAIIVVAPAGSAFPPGAADNVLTKDWAATVKQGVYDWAWVWALASVLFAVCNPVATTPTVFASQADSNTEIARIGKRRCILMSQGACSERT